MNEKPATCSSCLPTSIRSQYLFPPIVCRDLVTCDLPGLFDMPATRSHRGGGGDTAPDKEESGDRLELEAMQKELKALQEKFNHSQERIQELSQENAALKQRLQESEGVPKTSRKSERTATAGKGRGGSAGDIDIVDLKRIKEVYADTGHEEVEESDPLALFEEGDCSPLSSDGLHDEKEGRKPRKKKRLKGRKKGPFQSEREKAVVEFLDEVYSKPMVIRGKDEDDSDVDFDYDTNQLDPFKIVIKKKVDALLKDAVDQIKSFKEGKGKRRVEFFSQPPLHRENTSNLRLEDSSIDSQRRIISQQQISHNARHEDKPTPTPNCVCEICGYTSEIKAQLLRHMLTHGDAQFPCPCCGKKSKRKDDLKKHIARMHQPKNYRFSCSMCPMRFIDSTGLKRHERSHLGIKPHLCSKCGRGFSESRNLRLHTESQHQGNGKSCKRVSLTVPPE